MALKMEAFLDEITDRARFQLCSSVGIALSHGLDDWGFESQQGLGIFLFTTASRLAVGPIQPPVQCILDALSLGVKQLGHEADHSPPSSAEVKECVELYFHSPYMPSRRGAPLKKSTGTTLPLPLPLPLLYPIDRVIAMLGGSLVTMAWCILRLRLEGRPPDTEGSCECIE
jgi:hypothetical protein